MCNVAKACLCVPEGVDPWPSDLTCEQQGCDHVDLCALQQGPGPASRCHGDGKDPEHSRLHGNRTRLSRDGDNCVTLPREAEEAFEPIRGPLLGGAFPPARLLFLPLPSIHSESARIAPVRVTDTTPGALRTEPPLLGSDEAERRAAIAALQRRRENGAVGGKERKREMRSPWGPTTPGWERSVGSSVASWDYQRLGSTERRRSPFHNQVVNPAAPRGHHAVGHVQRPALYPTRCRGQILHRQRWSFFRHDRYRTIIVSTLPPNYNLPRTPPRDVLNFLRSGDLPPRERVRSVYKEAQYYSIGPLLDSLQELQPLKGEQVRQAFLGLMPYYKEHLERIVEIAKLRAVQRKARFAKLKICVFKEEMPITPYECPLFNSLRFDRGDGEAKLFEHHCEVDVSFGPWEAVADVYDLLHCIVTDLSRRGITVDHQCIGVCDKHLINHYYCKRPIYEFKITWW
ncbi:BTB/POZ domain-containing protein KCTD7 [Varanus komodoensis]|uniref:BTB/POZ domain-containing protein KCTD7 n=1 Tax=Varanus komodoensis TaxID=61221 RepID=UPI001CF7C3C7|nr:BTB/POZ domain-containing protein KCTD7 [Varanus komodoensis]